MAVLPHAAVLDGESVKGVNSSGGGAGGLSKK
jgi:hypothetical protein